jgi:DNA modification methylase
MQINNVAIGAVVPYARNPRRNDAAISKVAASLQEFGWRQPIVVDAEMVVVAGHTRLEAARSLGMGEVPIHVATGLTPEQIKAYRLADNRVGQEAEWDQELLRLELGELESMDFALDLTGFDSDELLELMADPFEEGQTDPDEVPDLPEEPVTKPGDLWLLGQHRLLCGDSTNQTDLDILLNGQKADMVFTDPPYNANYKSTGANSKLKKGILNDAMTDKDFDRFIETFTSIIVESSQDGAAFYICCNWKDSYPRLYSRLSDLDVTVSACIVWDKESAGMGWQDYRFQYEFIIYGFNNKGSHRWMGGRTETDIWPIKRVARQKYIHPTQKPVSLAVKAVENSSKKGATVLDLFGGSGMTLMACHISGRTSYLMELDPKYCDVIVQRWENFTGRKAELDS